MKLYIKQKVFSFKDKFKIKDEEGNDKYIVEGKFLSLGKKLYVFDKIGNEVAYIEQKVLSFMPKFFVYVKGEKIAEVHRKFTILKPLYEITEKNWITSGKILGHEYTITDNLSQSVVANIQKAWLTWGDYYEVNINDKWDEISVISVVLAIDAAIASIRK